MEKPFRHIHLFDTSVATDNIGDEIIVEACRRELGALLDTAYVTSSSSHDGMGAVSRTLAADADIVFMLGTNALSQKRAKLFKPYKWHVSRADLQAVRNKVVLVGVGAGKSFTRVEAAQRKFLRQVLSHRHIHSVRDASALRIVEECGLRAVNTSCPTLWRWRGTDLPAPTKPDAVCFTLTLHKPDRANDRAMIDILRARYEKLWFWPQQPRDLGYLEELCGTEGIGIVPPNLPSYDAVLGSGVDVIGTRLHGTIRGLMHGCRGIVISIDNRASEIGAHTGLEVIPRDKVSEMLPAAIANRTPGPLKIDGAAIDTFLGQFARAET